MISMPFSTKWLILTFDLKEPTRLGPYLTNFEKSRLIQTKSDGEQTFIKKDSDS